MYYQSFFIIVLLLLLFFMLLARETREQSIIMLSLNYILYKCCKLKKLPLLRLATTINKGQQLTETSLSNTNISQYIASLV